MEKQTFNPPDAEQVRRHLESHPPRSPAGWVVWAPLIVLGVVAGLTFTVDHAMMAMLPWLLLAGVLGTLSWRAATLRQLEQRIAQAHELAMLRHWRPALRMAWRLLPQASATPQLHGRTVALLAHLLDQVKAYDAAIVTYDYLLDHLPSDHPGAVQLRLQRALAQLATDRLTDADDALRRVRGLIERFAGTAMSATFRLANLFQQVRTHHFADAVAERDGLADDLRPLGIEAGYGHALMALSCHRLAQAGQQQWTESARKWWGTATLLMPVEALVWRYEELAPMASAMPACPRPWEMGLP